jgi:hypothetical protein
MTKPHFAILVTGYLFGFLLNITLASRNDRASTSAGIIDGNNKHLKDFLDFPLMENFELYESEDFFLSCLSLTASLQNKMRLIEVDGISVVAEQLKWEIATSQTGTQAFRLNDCTIRDVLKEFCNKWDVEIYVHGDYLRFEKTSMVPVIRDSILIKANQ